MRRRIAIAWPTRGLWRHDDFLRLWAAQAISAFGSRISRTVLPVVAIVTIDAGPAEIGILAALSVAPGALVGLLLGGRVDRAAKRPLLVGCDVVRAALLCTVPVTAWLDVLAMPQLYVVAAAVGAATALFQIADNAYLPALIGRPHLVEGNAKLEATDAMAEVGGPSLAGLLVELVTAPAALLFDALSYVVSAALLGRIRAPEARLPADSDSPTLLRDLAIGWSAGFGNPLVRPLLLVEANRAFFGGFFFALYMIFAIDTLGLSPGVVGLLIGVGGVGAFIGALIARHLPRSLGLGPAMVGALTLAQATELLIPLAAGPDWLVLGFLVTHQLAGDALMVAYMVHAVSLRQTVLPLDVLGRANATLQALTGALMPAGALIAGVLAAGLGVRAGIWIGVAGGLLAPVVLALSPVRGLRRMPGAV